MATLAQQADRVDALWDDFKTTCSVALRSSYTDGRDWFSLCGTTRQRTFEVVRVGKTKPVGFSSEPKPDRAVRYDGTAVEVRLE